MERGALVRCGWSRPVSGDHLHPQFIGRAVHRGRRVLASAPAARAARAGALASLRARALPVRVPWRAVAALAGSHLRALHSRY